MSCTIKKGRPANHRLDEYKQFILDALNSNPRPSYKEIASDISIDSLTHTTDAQISNYCNTRFNMVKPIHAIDLMPEFHEWINSGLSRMQAMSKLNSKHGTDYSYKTLGKAYTEYKDGIVAGNNISLLNVPWNSEGLRSLVA